MDWSMQRSTERGHQMNLKSELSIAIISLREQKSQGELRRELRSCCTPENYHSPFPRTVSFVPWLLDLSASLYFGVAALVWKIRTYRRKIAKMKHLITRNISLVLLSFYVYNDFCMHHIQATYQLIRKEATTRSVESTEFLSEGTWCLSHYSRSSKWSLRVRFWKTAILLTICNSWTSFKAIYNNK